MNKIRSEKSGVTNRRGAQYERAASLSESARKSCFARDAGIGYRTAQRWKMRYRKYGLPGLARDDRSDRGWRRGITVELKEILEALALQKPPLPIAALYRQICKIAQQRGLNTPTYKVVYRIVRELPRI